MAQMRGSNVGEIPLSHYPNILMIILPLYSGRTYAYGSQSGSKVHIQNLVRPLDVKTLYCRFKLLIVFWALSSGSTI